MTSNKFNLTILILSLAANSGCSNNSTESSHTNEKPKSKKQRTDQAISNIRYHNHEQLISPISNRSLSGSINGIQTKTITREDLLQLPLDQIQDIYWRQAINEFNGVLSQAYINTENYNSFYMPYFHIGPLGVDLISRDLRDADISSALGYQGESFYYPLEAPVECQNDSTRHRFLDYVEKTTNPLHESIEILCATNLPEGLIDKDYGYWFLGGFDISGHAHLPRGDVFINKFNISFQDRPESEINSLSISGFRTIRERITMPDGTAAIHNKEGAQYDNNEYGEFLLLEDSYVENLTQTLADGSILSGITGSKLMSGGVIAIGDLGIVSFSLKYLPRPINADYTWDFPVSIYKIQGAGGTSAEYVSYYQGTILTKLDLDGDGNADLGKYTPTSTVCTTEELLPIDQLNHPPFITEELSWEQYPDSELGAKVSVAFNDIDTAIENLSVIYYWTDASGYPIYESLDPYLPPENFPQYEDTPVGLNISVTAKISDGVSTVASKLYESYFFIDC